MLYRRKQGRNRKKNLAYADIANHECQQRREARNNPLQILLAAEKVELVHVALQKLTAGECEVLLLKYREGWSCRQISDRLGVSTSAVKNRLLRARQNLRIELVKNHDWNEL